MLDELEENFIHGCIHSNYCTMSVKQCPKCGIQGQCTDSRQMSDYVRRRYHCRESGCGHSWTSAEFLISEGDNKGGCKVKRYFVAKEREAMNRAIDRLKILVAEEPS